MIALFGLASAAQWTVDVGDRVLSSADGTGNAPVVAGGASFELAPWLRLEPSLLGGFGATGPLALASLEARLGPADGVTALLGGQGGLDGTAGARVTAGAGYEWQREERLRPRAAARLLVGAGLEPGALLSVGFRLAARPAPQPVEVAEVAEVKPPIAPLDANPDDALVFVPHPICEWLPAEEAHAILQHLEPGDPVRVVAPGYLPVEVEVEEGPEHQPLPVPLKPAPAQGTVVVVAQPGDDVFVDGHPVPVGKDGLAIVTTPEGPHQVQVRGAGRVVDLTTAVGDGYAAWVRSPPPDRLITQFAVGSSELTPQARRDIAFYAETVGNWGFELQGSFSPEGDWAANQKLAKARGRAVQKAMVDAGIPRDRIEIVPPPEVPEDMDTANQRSCIIVPISRGWE